MTRATGPLFAGISTRIPQDCIVIYVHDQKKILSFERLSSITRFVLDRPNRIACHHRFIYDSIRRMQGIAVGSIEIPSFPQRLTYEIDLVP
jgi:hypothetical protein